MDEMKVCTGPCGLPKPLDQFVRRIRCFAGRASICRECFRQKIRDAYAERKVQPVETREVPEVFTLDLPRCTCMPRAIGQLVAHDAGCMIFKHNRLDGVSRSHSLEDVARVYGG